MRVCVHAGAAPACARSKVSTAKRSKSTPAGHRYAPSELIELLLEQKRIFFHKMWGPNKAYKCAFCPKVGGTTVMCEHVGDADSGIGCIFGKLPSDKTKYSKHEAMRWLFKRLKLGGAFAELHPGASAELLKAVSVGGDGYSAEELAALLPHDDARDFVWTNNYNHKAVETRRLEYRNADVGGFVVGEKDNKKQVKAETFARYVAATNRLLFHNPSDCAAPPSVPTPDACHASWSLVVPSRSPSWL